MTTECGGWKNSVRNCEKNIFSMHTENLCDRINLEFDIYRQATEGNKGLGNEENNQDKHNFSNCIKSSLFGISDAYNG